MDGPWGPEPGFLHQFVYEEAVGSFSFQWVCPREESMKWLVPQGSS